MGVLTWVEIIFLILMLADSFVWWWVWGRHRYVGVGWALEYNSASGNVIVGTRLLQSPSGQAGVPIGARVHTFRGYEMKFGNGDEFVAFMHNLPDPCVGDAVPCRLESDGRVYDVEMYAEVIQGPIPDNRPPAPLSFEERPYIDEGLAVCRRTGEFRVTRRLSGAAVNNIFV